MNARSRFEIVTDLVEHLNGDGTLNDNTTDGLWREYYDRNPEETDLEEVERWAVDMCEKRAKPQRDYRHPSRTHRGHSCSDCGKALK